MAGAFLPWEEWIAKLLHPIAVAVRKRVDRSKQQRLLIRSKDWQQTEGTILNINSDFANPREEVTYFYSTTHGYRSGAVWRWLDSSNAREVRVNDKVKLRYNEENPDESVIVDVL